MITKRIIPCLDVHCLFAYGNGKCFCGTVCFLNSLMAADGSLSK